MLLKPQSLFLTGTDTEIGKTTAGAALARSWASVGARVAAMKPIAAGLVDGLSEDLLFLESACNLRLPREMACPYAFEAPIAPHLAAIDAGVRITANDIAAKYRECQQWVHSRDQRGIKDASTPYAAAPIAIIVEGAGGALVPLNDREDMLDIAATCALPVVFVVGLRLGCINHARLTELAIQSRGLHCLGWIANVLNPDMPFLHENFQTLRQCLRTPLLGVCPFRGETLSATLRGV